MDLVYPFTGVRFGELRYSLRSMSRYQPHGRVWLIGQPPEHMFEDVGVITIPKGNNRWRNTSDAILEACNYDAISDPFVLMNDDFVCLDEKAHTYWDRGPLTDTLIPHRRNTEYRRGGIDALHLLKDFGIADPLSFELHIPMIVSKELMCGVIEALRGCKASEAFKRTVYGNLIEGPPTESRTDVKAARLPLPAPDWVSTSNSGWDGALGDTIRDMFPDPCAYEGA